MSSPCNVLSVELAIFVSDEITKCIHICMKVCLYVLYVCMHGYAPWSTLHMLR